MTNAELFLEIKMDLGDVEGNIYSYFAITRAVNFVYRTIGNYLPRTAPDLKEVATLTVSDGSAELPSDFHSIQSIWSGTKELLPNVGQEQLNSCTYEQRGNTIYTAATGDLTLYYKKQLSAITPSDTPEGNVPLPDSFIETIKKYAILYLTGSTSAELLALIEKDVKIIGASRDRSRIQPKAAYYI